MTRTRKASVDNPKHETTDSRRQIKSTKLEMPGRTKLDHPKKSGRLSAFDHDKLAKGKASEERETTPRASDEDEEMDTTRASSPHHVPPRGSAPRARSPASATTSGTLVSPKAAPRAAAAVAVATSVSAPAPTSPTFIKVRTTSSTVPPSEFMGA